MALPDYDPPCARRACVAAGGAPLLVLAGFVLLVLRLIELDSLLALLAAAVVWLAWELHDWQSRLDRYDADYIGRHLAWRSDASLHALLPANDGGHAPTREFVLRYLAAGRATRLRDGLPV